MVVAAAACRRRALYRRERPFLARPVGALSAPAFSLCRPRARPAHPGFVRTASVDQPLRRCASCRADLRPAAAVELCHDPQRLLECPALQYLDPVLLDDGRVDSRVHRALLLAAPETLLQ